MRIWAAMLAVFWIGVLWGAIANEDDVPFALILPAIVTILTVLTLAAKGLGF